MSFAYEENLPGHDYGEEGGDEEMRNAMRGVVNHLEGLQHAAIDHKYTVETRWLRDERQYWGIQYGLHSFRGETEDEENELTIPENKTRQKTRTMAARIADMLFPTNDKNYAILPTPEPTDIDGNPVDKAQAEDAAKRMENKIGDFLTECNYSKQGRKAIFDGCKLGTGILKGPFSSGTVKRVARRQWEEVFDDFGQPMIDPQTGEPIMEPGGIEVSEVYETKPAAVRVDPWMWFPAPARNVDECEYSFELHLWSKERFIKAAGYPDFDKDAIRKILAQSPTLGHERGLLAQRLELLRPTQQRLDNLYSVWEYHGPLKAKHARALGIELDEDDPLETLFVEIWSSQGHILKIEMAPISNDHRIPYYAWSYEDDEADVFGYGVPFIMRNEQFVIDKTYSAMVHNASLTSGPQSIEFKGKVVPGDGKKEIRGPKHWIAQDPDMTDFKEAIQFHNIESTIPQTMPIYQLANQNADENTALPMMAQGEASGQALPASGMAMLMNASNIVQRMAAHTWDDEVTLPLIRRFYYWMLLYDEDDSLKLDMEIDPRGASYLLVKDIQAQHAMNLLTLANNDPELRATLKIEELHKTVIHFMDVPTDRIVKTEKERAQDAEAMAEQQQIEQQNIQLEMQERAAKAEEAMAKAQKAMAEAQNVGMDNDPERGQREFMLKMRELDLKENEIMAVIYRADAHLQETLARIESQEVMSEQDRAMRAQMEDRRAEMQAMIAEMNNMAKQRQMDQQEYLTGMRMAVDMKREQNRRQNIEMGKDAFRS